MSTESNDTIDLSALDPEDVEVIATGEDVEALKASKEAAGAKPEAQQEDAAEDEREDSSEEDGKDPREPVALPKYNPEDPKVLDSYDEQFFQEDGELNVGRLSEIWDASVKDLEVGDGDLGDDVYAYLKDRIGLPKDKVKELEKGLFLLRKQEVSSVYERFGGKDQYEAGIKWAKDGGYTEAERARYTAAIKKGGQDADDAIDAFQARFLRATGQTRRGPPRPRSVSPRKEVGGGAPTTSVQEDVFASQDDYALALREARATGKESAVNTVRAKLKRSTFWKP